VKEKEIEEELVSIRSMMERSSKFISLSGLSGILAGVYALIGASYAYHIIYYGMADEFNPYILNKSARSTSYGSLWVNFSYYSKISVTLGIIALIVLVASVGTGIFLSIRKSKRKGQPIWSSASRGLLFHMATPLITGGILIVVLIIRGHYSIAAPMSLVFYGLALVSASNFTYKDVRYLGLCEIALGLIAACLPGYGLLFWAIGFGLLHIIYGSLMYFKYDK
jgi:hypothetical protein